MMNDNPGPGKRGLIRLRDGAVRRPVGIDRRCHLSGWRGFLVFRPIFGQRIIQQMTPDPLRRGNVVAGPGLRRRLRTRHGHKYGERDKS